jgi:POT family proton-dependent oligopeptide transporter
MGINLGAFFSPIVCGFLGEKIGWHYGFSAAAVGMLAGLGVFVLWQKLLGNVGLPPRFEPKEAPKQEPAEAPPRSRSSSRRITWT